VLDVKSLYDRFLMARQAMRQIGRASGMFGSLKQARKARRMLGGLPGAWRIPPRCRAVESTRRASRPREKIARRRKLQDARKARRRTRG